MAVSVSGWRGFGQGHVLVAALACGSGMLYAGVDAIAADRPAAHTVVIDGVKFDPATLTVRRGDTVEWVNHDPFPHTATAPGFFDSHIIAAGKSWRFTARKTGEYAYVCTLHPSMKATLIVD